MAGKQIKQEIVLSGEKQYNAAIKEAQRNLKTLQTALKAETAEMGKNATAQEKNAAKVKSLKEQIKEQEKIVQTLREALAAAKEEYGDNGAEVARWEQKLNNARTTLANMQNDLQVSGEKASRTTVEIKAVADSLASIGSTGESVSNAIESIFTGMIDTVSGAVSELWGLISETAAKANNWTDIAGYWGTDAQTIQQYARAVGASANSFEDLQSAVSKIVLGGKGKKITELLGLSDVNYENEWDYAMLVMNRLNEMTKEGQNMTPIYEQIFGEKKSTKVMDLINDWDTIQELLPQFNGNQSGYGMSDEELSTMNDLDVKIAEIEHKWEALKENVAGGFGAVTMDLLVNVEGTLDGIADYLNAKDDAGKQAALEKIRANVEEFFTKLGEIIRECIGILRDVGGDLQGSDDPLTSAIGSILVSLADSLQWMVDHAEEVKGAFETIFGVWLIVKLAAVAGKLSAILAQIKVIQGFKGLSAATAAAKTAGDAAVEAGSGTGGGALGLLGIVKAAIPNVLAAWGTWELSKLIPADWATKLTGGTAAEVGEIQRKNGIETVGDAMNQVAANPEQSKKSLGLMWEALTNPTAGTKKDVAEEVAEAVDEGIQESMTAAQAQALEAFWDAWRADELAGHTDESQEGLVSAWDAYEAAFAGQEGLYNKVDELLTRFQEEAGSGWTGIEDLPLDWYSTLLSGSGAGTKDENGITGADLRNFNSLPAAIQTAVASGASSGVSGIKVTLDGAAVGRLVAPYVSEIIGSQIVAARNQ